MTVTVGRLNRQTRGSVERALAYEAELTDLYAQQLRRAGRHAAAQFTQHAPVALAAATNPTPPDWVAPDPDELTTEPLDRQARLKARRIHLRALVAAVPQAIKDTADRLGITFDADSPFVEQLLDRTAERAVSLTQETRDVMRKIIGQAYKEGWSVPQTAAALQDQISGLGKTTAVMQARTDLVGLGNGASLASARALGDDAPATKVWLTAGDELVRETHADAEGQEVPIDQPFQVGDDLLMYPGDPDGSDAEVINCFPAGTLIAGTVCGAMRARYTGTLVTVTTRRGRRLSGTPNHPVLTSTGWKGLGEVAEGDHLVCASFNQGTMASAPDVEDVPSRIEQVFDALAPEGFCPRVRACDVNFYGDRPDGDVDVVRADGFLELPCTPAGFKPGQKLELAIADELPTGFSRARLRRQFLRRSDLLAAGGVRLGSESGFLSIGHAAVADQESFARGAAADAALVQSPLDRLTADSEAGGDLQFGELLVDVEADDFVDVEIDAVSAPRRVGFGEVVEDRLVIHAEQLADLPGGQSLAHIEIDDVLGVDVRAFQGDVFTVTTEQGYYIANGVCVANCRCTVVYGDGDRGDQLEASAAPAGGSGRPVDPLSSPAMETQSVSSDVTFAASGDTGLPLSERDRAWDAGEATGRVKKWASSDGSGDPDKIDFDKLGRAYFWRDSAGDGGAAIGDFKLPFADVVDGKLTAVWRGVTAAAGRLSQTDIPASGKDAVRAKIGAYYAKARKTYDDPQIETPWSALVAAVTITVDDEDAETGGTDDAMAEQVRWRGILCVEGEPSQDSPFLVRMLQPGGGTWRDLPLPLGVIFDTPHASGDVEAPVAGGIDSIYRDSVDPRIIWGEGWFNEDEIGCRAAELVNSRSLRGVSIDPYVAEVEIAGGDGDMVDDALDTADEGPTMVTFTRYVIGGATVCPFQALESATIAIVAAANIPETTWVAVDGLLVVSPATEPNEEPAAMTAAAAAEEKPPRAWFETQEPPGLMPLTVTDDGRVFGHLADWASCHTGFPNACVTPPRSPSGYAYFHVGELETAEGDRVSVGKLMISKTGTRGGHAPTSGVGRLEAQRHYDDQTAVGAYIRVVDGRYGPWASGVVRPGLDEDGIAELRANPPSGDWRRVNGALELIAALAVPVPGFPIPRAEVGMVASGDEVHVDALVASSGELSASELAVRALQLAGVLPGSGVRVQRPAAASAS